ncbi:50S ribosomal protein L15 [Desulfobulbus oligotrophicus]|jgi:large subunit ribosomal protein L15|uniref:Large ribosomal subunit protein uL15 n=1 Tax=Desulfobulbus oligotrophicus TaxID=1909699 RepID=A0A7T5VD93_9BACT|nr:50S ribosomal protein L15 [Desulfobulbus oligotrophicus]MDY0390381.1 50S ribosomal protein L15 [Desulfobulbus oligotrophicus]QQG65743.1 50S ribosomal protein L15 [Desulfobulbus oligotrophicus]
MLTLNNLVPAEGSRRPKKRVGRGPGSGLGKTSGRGHKGARSRSGYKIHPGFEGGQMPLYRRLPKRGFTNLFKKTYTLVSLDQLNTFEAGSVVNTEALVAAGILDKNGPVKVLANGEITKALTIELEKISHGAKEKIIAAGGVIKE